MKAASYLSDIKRYNKLIENKLIELTQLRNMATSITASITNERVQTSSNGDKIGNAVSKIADCERELDKIIDEFIDEKNKRIKLIECVKDPVLYDVLHKHYVQFKSFSDIAASMHYSKEWIYELHNNALNIVQEFLNEELTKVHDT